MQEWKPLWAQPPQAEGSVAKDKVLQSSYLYYCI